MVNHTQNCAAVSCLGRWACHCSEPPMCYDKPFFLNKQALDTRNATTTPLDLNQPQGKGPAAVLPTTYYCYSLGQYLQSHLTRSQEKQRSCFTALYSLLSVYHFSNVVKMSVFVSENKRSRIINKTTQTFPIQTSCRE